MKNTRPFLPILLFVLLSVQVQAQSMSPCQPCADLEALRLPDVKISSVEAVEEPVAHCKLSGVIGKEIRFEVVLPQQWNERFSLSGNGGFAGAIQTGHARVRQGFANAATDTGHQGGPLDASWAQGQAERQVNFGHLAIHRTAVTAKEIVLQYYCAAPRYSYFVGCSRGGGQGMMAAQRYPEDFDGIVAGAPAFSWPAMAAEFVRNCQSVYPDELAPSQPIITSSNLEILQRHILSQCDTLDGLADGILNDPRACHFDLSSLPSCRAEQAGEDCFTTEQMAAIREIYAPTSLDGKSIYPGFPFGGENEPGGWQAWMTGPKADTSAGRHFSLGTEIFKYMVFHDSSWDFRQYDFTNFYQHARHAASFLDATSADYEAFHQGGGKMLLYHGWSDPALSALATIEHYEAVQRRDPHLQNYLRLYLLPGVLHCGGGPGPSQTDWLQLVQDWVEKGQAPEKVVLSKRRKGQPTLTRPVFPYPDLAVYDGKGDPNLESSFKRK